MLCEDNKKEWNQGCIHTRLPRTKSAWQLFVFCLILFLASDSLWKQSQLNKRKHFNKTTDFTKLFQLLPNYFSNNCAEYMQRSPLVLLPHYWYECGHQWVEGLTDRLMDGTSRRLQEAVTWRADGHCQRQSHLRFHRRDTLRFHPSARFGVQAP